jgi:hypothetical protein
MKSTNLALLTKLGWTFLNEAPKVWVQQLHKKYISYGNFLSAPSSSSASWFWQGLQKCKPLLASGACLQVSTCSNYPFWTTAWIPTMPSFLPQPKFPNNREFPVGFILDFIHASTTQWNLEALRSVFNEISVSEISKIRISLISQPRFLWTFSNSGKFSSKSAFLQLKSSQDDLPVLPGINPDFWKKIWTLNLNDRLRLFLWKIAWNILPTRERVSSVFSTMDSLSQCPLCSSGEDSLSHLFLRCCFARILWRLSPWPLDLAVFQFSTMVDWIKVILFPDKYLQIPQTDLHYFQIFASVAYDLLWTHRNKAFPKVLPLTL